MRERLLIFGCIVCTTLLVCAAAGPLLGFIWIVVCAVLVIEFVEARGGPPVPTEVANPTRALTAPTARDLDYPMISYPYRGIGPVGGLSPYLREPTALELIASQDPDAAQRVIRATNRTELRLAAMASVREAGVTALQGKLEEAVEHVRRHGIRRGESIDTDVVAEEKIPGTGFLGHFQETNTLTVRASNRRRRRWW